MSQEFFQLGKLQLCVYVVTLHFLEKIIGNLIKVHSVVEYFFKVLGYLSSNFHF